MKSFAELYFSSSDCSEYYHKLFHYAGESSQGILFKKSKEEVNELLFVHYLYKQSKKKLIAEYKRRINETQEKLEQSDDEKTKEKYEKSILNYERLKAIANICVFYCMAYYYDFKDEFSSLDKGLKYRYEDYYSDKVFQSELIDGFMNLFLVGTIEIIKELTVSSPNLNTWVRDKKSTRL